MIHRTCNCSPKARASNPWLLLRANLVIRKCILGPPDTELVSRGAWADLVHRPGQCSKLLPEPGRHPPPAWLTSLSSLRV